MVLLNLWNRPIYTLCEAVAVLQSAMSYINNYSFSKICKTLYLRPRPIFLTKTVIILLYHMPALWKKKNPERYCQYTWKSPDVIVTIEEVILPTISHVLEQPGKPSGCSDHIFQEASGILAQETVVWALASSLSRYDECPEKEKKNAIVLVFIFKEYLIQPELSSSTSATGKIDNKIWRKNITESMNEQRDCL